MLLHDSDSEPFEDYLLEHLGRLDFDKSQVSGGRTLPHLDNSRISHSTRAVTNKSHKSYTTAAAAAQRALPNLLENTLVARFKRVEVSPNAPRVSCEGQSSGLGLLPGGSYSRATFTDVCWYDKKGWHGEDGFCVKRSTPILRRKNRNSSSAPCGRDAEMEALMRKEQLRREENERIQNAVVTVREARKKYIKDRVLGVPKAFVAPKPHFKLIYDKSGEYRRGKQYSCSSSDDQRSNTSQEDNRSLTGEEKMERKQFKPEVPGSYVFPKEENFIPEVPLTVGEAGVDWSLHSKQKSVRIFTKKVAKDNKNERQEPVKKIKKDLKDRCKIFYPVTEALHKEGTSITKLKSHAPKPGEVKVAKVWMQDSDPNTPPAHLAKSIKLDLPKGPREAFKSVSPYRIPFRPPPQAASC